MLRAMPRPGPDVARHAADYLRTRRELGTLAIFAPLPGEPDLLLLPELVPGRTWCLPRVIDETRLTFHIAEDLARLRPAAFGVREPTAEAPPVATAEIDAFICPGLAFDRRGGRLGRGRGYYDRALAGARPGAVFIGVCFDNQLVESIDREPHDVRMRAVITESGLVPVKT